MQYNKDDFNKWWERLKLNKNYHSICEFASKQEEDAFKFPPIRLLNELSRNENFKPVKKYMKLLAVYEKFGDVRNKDFADWWKNYNRHQPKPFMTEKELRDYKEERDKRQYEADRRQDEQLQLYEGIRWKIIYFPNTYDKRYVNTNLGQKDAADVIKARKEDKSKHNAMRTAKATDTKQEKYAIKERYVIEAYTKMVNDKLEKEILKTLSENKMAQLIKERVENDLKKVKTSGHKSVLKSKVGHKDNIIVTGLSPRTIIRILRNRDKSKFPFYPWEKK